MQQAKILVIVGPTASGKTSLAIDLAKRFNGEIICADSRTIYSGMDIGTAKPSKSDQKLIKHYMLDIVEPNQSFSVVKYKQQALEAISQIKRNSKLPIIVGGSGMYIDSLLFDYQFRGHKLGKNIDGLSIEAKKAQAKILYPDYYNNIQGNNVRRLDQLLMYGPAGEEDRESLKLDCLIVGLSPKELMLKHNIELRASQMLNNNFVHEVEFLRAKYGPDAPGLSSTGYRQVGMMLDGELQESELLASIIKASNKLAKKQFTWFRRNKHINWFDSGDKSELLIAEYLN